MPAPHSFHEGEGHYELSCIARMSQLLRFSHPFDCVRLQLQPPQKIVLQSFDLTIETEKMDEYHQHLSTAELTPREECADNRRRLGAPTPGLDENPPEVDQSAQAPELYPFSEALQVDTLSLLVVKH